MAQYKVIQDIEAEDKLLGPLTLKAFIYAIIAVLCAFINFKLLVSTGVGPLRWLLILIFLPPMLLFGVLASPLGRHQPTEVWLLARIRFLIKARKRLWSQSGLQHLVTITAPKKLDKVRTKGLSETEVRSRLQTLATTLDSRGWAIRNATVAPDLLQREEESDRLVAPTTISTIDSGIDIHPADDIMDETSNPTAQYFASLMEQADADRKVGVANRLNKARANVNQAETNQPPPVESSSQNSTGSSTKTEAKNAANSVTDATRADKLELAQSGNDFSVATLSRLANRKGQFTQIGPDEVVLTLH